MKNFVPNFTKNLLKQNSVHLLIFLIRRSKAKKNSKPLKNQIPFQKNHSFSNQKIQIIPMPSNSLPKIRQVTNDQRKKIKMGKFTAQKLIVNQTIYIHEKKRFQKVQSAEQFKQIGKSILSERSKRLTFLHKKQAQQNYSSINFKNGQKKIESVNINNKILNLNPEQTSIQFKKNKLIETILKVQQKKSKVQQSYKQVQLSKKKLLTDAFNDQMMGDTVQIPKASLTVKKPRHNSKKLTPFIKEHSFQKKPFIKKFNWKKQPFTLNKIQKGEVTKLLRKYLHVANVSPPNLGFYKVYVGQGNNSQLIKQCLKSRGYWMIVDSVTDKPNLVWTQLNQLDIHNSTFKGQQKRFTSNLIGNIHLSNEQISNFIKFKSNDFIQGLKKLFTQNQFNSIISEIIKKFKRGLAISYFSQIEKYLKYFFTFQCNQNTIKASELQICNHILNSPSIGNKKGLYKTLVNYCDQFKQKIQNLVPTTVHVQFKLINKFDYQQNFEKKVPKGPWILKPGQDTNRGRGISIHLTKQSLFSQIKKRSNSNEQQKSLIVQRYIQPFLYNNRKFDIRMWVLWSKNKLWWYKQGYIRTSCKQFNIKNTNKYIHLTNDAVQNTCDQYGKYQPANKISFNQFQKYLQNHHSSLNFNNVYEQMKNLTKKLFKTASKAINQNSLNFQLFGLDFLIDKDFKVWIIQANTNPCLDICCSLLSRLIPNMIQNMMSIVIDPLFPCPEKRIGKQSLINSWNNQSFKFQLLYNGDQESNQGQSLKKESPQNQMLKQKIKTSDNTNTEPNLINIQKVNSYQNIITE